MSFFIWDSKFDLKISEMNEEHKKLISLMDEVYQENELCKSKESVLIALSDLGKYIIFHFKNEEIYMKEIHYPKLATHKLIHIEILKTYKEHINKFKFSTKNKISNEFFNFLKVL